LVEPKNTNEWADYWRYQRGVNVIPANTRQKKVIIDWKHWQNSPIPESQHVEWKQKNSFNDGMAIIAGKVWHNPKKSNLYLICVDFDNQTAINEFCSRNGTKTPLVELAKKIIIEQHLDQPDKAHAMFYATHPFPKKSSDVARLSHLMENEDIPLIEIKGSGEHGLLFVTPSTHKDGFNYEIIGTLEPEVVDEMETHLQEVCARSGIKYPSNNVTTNPGNLIPIQDLFNENTIIYEGEQQTRTIA
jgi:hypothetical protein